MKFKKEYEAYNYLLESKISADLVLELDDTLHPHAIAGPVGCGDLGSHPR